MIAQIFNTILSKKKRAEIKNEIKRTFVVSDSTVRNWLSGRNTPPMYTWKKISEIMGKSLLEVFPIIDKNTFVSPHTLSGLIDMLQLYLKNSEDPDIPLYVRIFNKNKLYRIDDIEGFDNGIVLTIDEKCSPCKTTFKQLKPTVPSADTLVSAPNELF